MLVCHSVLSARILLLCRRESPSMARTDFADRLLPSAPQVELTELLGIPHLLDVSDRIRLGVAVDTRFGSMQSFDRSPNDSSRFWSGRFRAVHAACV